MFPFLTDFHDQEGLRGKLLTRRRGAGNGLSKTEVRSYVWQLRWRPADDSHGVCHSSRKYRLSLRPPSGAPTPSDSSREQRRRLQSNHGPLRGHYDRALSSRLPQGHPLPERANPWQHSRSCRSLETTQNRPINFYAPSQIAHPAERVKSFPKVLRHLRLIMPSASRVLHLTVLPGKAIGFEFL